MFDLETIEKDWLNNSFKLSEEDVIKIYQSEGATLSKYEEELAEYKRNTHLEISAEERLLRSIFGQDKEIIESEKKLREQYVFPEKRRLSKESQNKVIEGSLYLVFDSTKEWYKFFDGLISMEKIYYICLESLVNSVKYMLHCEKPVFELYVLKSIERNIIKYVAKWNKMTYREVYQIVNSYYYNFNKKDERNNLLCNFEISEEVIKPSSIFYQLRNESYDVDYLKNISSSEFMEDYNKFLETLDETERMIMNLSFDFLGNPGLTNAEISDYLGIEKNKVENTRRKIMKKLRKDSKINTYRKK